MRKRSNAPCDHQEKRLRNALARTRTAMPFSTSTSSLRVYQFHHEGDRRKLLQSMLPVRCGASRSQLRCQPYPQPLNIIARCSVWNQPSATAPRAARACRIECSGHSDLKKRPGATRGARSINVRRNFQRSGEQAAPSASAGTEASDPAAGARAGRPAVPVSAAPSQRAEVDAAPPSQPVGQPRPHRVSH